MKKSIYKITNKINGKIYIGQAKNINKRIKEHIKGSTSAISLAIQKHGEENFDFEILETDIEDYNEKEKYWIKKFNSYQKGYNLTEGGEDGAYERYPQEEIIKVKDLIKSGVFFEEIKKETGHSVGFLTNLNYGRVYVDEKEIYPLSPNSVKLLSKEEVIFIEDFIIENSKLTLLEVAKRTGRSKTTIESIHKGTHKFSSDRDFPLKRKGSKLTVSEVFAIEDLLLNTNKSQSEIAIMMNREREVVSKINLGMHQLSNPKLKFPIR